MLSDRERQYLESARVARLASADADGRPNAVPICFALVDGGLVTPLDEKPKSGDEDALRRVRDVRDDPRVAVVVDHYTEEWPDLGWLQIRGTASVDGPNAADHDSVVDALRAKYTQYADHDLDACGTIRIEPGSVVSWGTLDPDVRSD